MLTSTDILERAIFEMARLRETLHRSGVLDVRVDIDGIITVQMTHKDFLKRFEWVDYTCSDFSVEGSPFIMELAYKVETLGSPTIRYMTLLTESEAKELGICLT